MHLTSISRATRRLPDFARPSSARARQWLGAAVLLAVGLVALMPAPFAEAKSHGCPEGMASIRGRYCIDRFEASVVEMGSSSTKTKGSASKRHSPFEPVEGLEVKAVSRRGAIPQGYISRGQAELACKNAGKRLCTDEEWVVACKGKHATTYPYGNDYEQGGCNDRGVSSFNKYYGPPGGGEAPVEAFTWDNMNDPRLNRLPGTVAATGAFTRCKSSFGVYDMVGNLHEWTQAPNGVFRGGYYLDVHEHGDGCDYKTTAHAPSYHDYSIGFRCCR
jgi:sulfatase modifying factor 1